MEKIYQVKVFGVEGEMKVIDLCSTSAEFNRLTVKDLKENIVQRFSVHSENLGMIFDGWCLDDDNSLLCDYGICHLSVIQLVLRLTAGEGPDDLPMEENSGMGDKTGKNLSACQYNYPQQKEYIEHQQAKLMEVYYETSEDEDMCGFDEPDCRVRNLSEENEFKRRPAPQLDEEHSGMGNKNGKNMSMERLDIFKTVCTVS